MDKWCLAVGQYITSLADQSSHHLNYEWELKIGSWGSGYLFSAFNISVFHRMWICCQIGAREHYAIPRVLHQNRLLETLYTDLWAGAAFRKMVGTSGLKTLRAYAGRFHPQLGDAPVVSWNVRSLFWEARLRNKLQQGMQKKESANQHARFIEAGSRFAIRVREALKRRADSVSDAIVFAYDTGALEVFQWCRERGIKCVLNQIDPSRVEMELVREEEKRWPNWASNKMEVPEEYFRRREQEWTLADRVVVNSEFCRQALLKQSTAPEKLFVMPLSYEVKRKELSFQLSAFSFSESSPLRVLWLGQVILRKGIQYLLEAARQLTGENIHFDIVGPIGISSDAVASAPRNVTFHGRATRDQAVGWYQQSHIFVLPTLSDGFAITQLEAMAHGLPVVTTACCGEVVSDGVDGFIISTRNATYLAKTLIRYLAEPGLLRDQQAAALAKSRQFTEDRLAANLLLLEKSLL